MYSPFKNLRKKKKIYTDVFFLILNMFSLVQNKGHIFFSKIFSLI